jgi:hypothetical protein
MRLYLYLLQAIAKMNDSELKLAIIAGFLFALAGLLDLLRPLEV